MLGVMLKVATNVVATYAIPVLLDMAARWIADERNRRDP